MKPKYITVDNYKQFKPSEFVRSFCADIDVAIKMKKPMDMEDFNYCPGSKCLPCLGGMACLNMGMPNSPGDWENLIQRSVSYLGNAIRIGKGNGISYHLMQLFPELKINDLSDRNYFRNTLNSKKLLQLKQQVNEYADELESLGY